MEQLVRESGLPVAEWEYSLGERSSAEHVAHLLFERNGDTIQACLDVRESWARVVRFFETVCSRMFEGRGSEASEALLYLVSAPEGNRVRWMSPDDISFLIAVGLRALIEECWSRRHIPGRYCQGLFQPLFLETLLWCDETFGCLP